MDEITKNKIINEMSGGKGYAFLTQAQKETLGEATRASVETIKPTTPIISSKDNQQQFRDDSTEVNNLLDQKKDTSKVGELNGGEVAGGKRDFTEPKIDTRLTLDRDGKQADETRDTTKTGDKAVDIYSKQVNDLQLKADKYVQDAEESKVDYANLYTTSLSAIDSTVASTIESIKSTYNKRINEQIRINKLNVDRTKAYGLSRGGRFTPLAFTDAISIKEEEGADKIAGLETKRNSLIAEAKSARDIGASKLLREKLNDLRDIDDELRTTLADIQTEADAQYQVLKETRKEEERLHLENVKKTVASIEAFAKLNADEYGAMSDEEKDTYISEIEKQNGGLVTYGEILSIVENATRLALSEALDIKGKKLSQSKTSQEIEIKNKERQEEKKMKEGIPTEFKDEDDANAQRVDFVKKYGEEGGKYWDSVFNKTTSDGLVEYQYPISGEKKKGKVTDDNPLGLDL